MWKYLPETRDQNKQLPVVDWNIVIYRVLNIRKIEKEMKGIIKIHKSDLNNLEYL